MLQENSWSCINYHINHSVLEHGLEETLEDMVMSHLGKRLHDGCRWKSRPSFLPKENNHKGMKGWTLQENGQIRRFVPTRARARGRAGSHRQYGTQEFTYSKSIFSSH